MPGLASDAIVSCVMSQAEHLCRNVPEGFQPEKRIPTAAPSSLRSLCHELANVVMWPLPQQGRGVSVGAPYSIPEREVLSVVVVEEEVMVYVVSGTIDHTYQGAGEVVVSIVYGNGPDVDKDKE